MRTQTAQKAELFARALRMGILGVFAVFVCTFLASLVRPALTDAAASSAINFQARLETAAGAIVADGYYNVEFKLYTVSTAGTAEWTEDYTYSNGSAVCSGPNGTGDCRVRVVNGYLTVNLGSITAFPGTINWSQQQWLGMNIGGTNGSGSIVYDGEMSPRLLLTAAPYAFTSGSLSVTSGANTGTLGFGSITNNPSLTLPNESGTLCVEGSANCGFATTGALGSYVQLQGGTPGTPQTGSFNISGTGIAATLQAGTFDQSASGVLAIGNTNATAINLGNTSSNILTTINGTALVKPTSGHDSASAFRVQNASGGNLLTVDTSNTAIVLGNDGTPSAMTVRGGAASGANTAGANLTFDASNGTGSGGSGDLIFRTAPGVAVTQVSQDATSNATASSQSSLTWTHTTTAAQSNLLMIVGVGITGSNTVSSVTYNGASLTKVGSVTCASGGNCDEELWYMVAPATGAHSVVVTASGSSNIYAGAVTYYNANQSSPLGSPVTNTGGSSPSSVTVSTSTSQTVVDGITDWSNGGLGSASAGQTRLWRLGGPNSGSSSKPGAAGSTTVGWSINYGNWAAIAVAVNSVGSSGADTLTDRLHITAAGNVGIDTVTPQYALDVTGDINSSTQLRVGGTVVCTSSGCTPAAGSNNYIQLQALTPGTGQTGNFNISGTGIAAVLEANTFDRATAGSLAIGNTNATAINIGNTSSNILTTINGTALVKPTTGHDSTTAFQVQNTGGSNLFTVDSTNTAIVLGNDGTPSAMTIRGGAATAANAAGTNLTFDASNGTGSGGSGDLIFQTASPASNTNVTLDNYQTESFGGNTNTTVTWTHTPNSSTNSILIVSVVTARNQAVATNGVTYEGTALTKLSSQLCGNSIFSPYCEVELWYMVNPATAGTNQISVTLTPGSTVIGASSVTYDNINTTTPFGTVNTISGATGGNQQITNPVTTTSVKQLVIDALASDNTTNTPGGTQLWSANGNGFVFNNGSSIAANGGTTNVTWFVNSGDYADIAVPLNPVVSNTPDNFTDRLHVTAGGDVGINNASPQYTLDVAGTGNFNVASTTAFQVQNGSGVNILNVDSTDSHVNIGAGSTGETAPSLLVLDSRTGSSSDPTGVNGAMYYNATLNAFRCYENGAWYNCLTHHIVTLGSNITNSNATACTIANVTGLSFSVTSGTTYRFHAQILYTAAATTTGSRWAINGPATTLLSYTSESALTAGSSASTNVSFQAASSYDAAGCSASSATTGGNIATIDGIIKPSANGTVTVRFASEVSSSAIIAEAGSTLEWW